MIRAESSRPRHSKAHWIKVSQTKSAPSSHSRCQDRHRSSQTRPLTSPPKPTNLPSITSCSFLPSSFYHWCMTEIVIIVTGIKSVNISTSHYTHTVIKNRYSDGVNDTLTLMSGLSVHALSARIGCIFATCINYLWLVTTLFIVVKHQARLLNCPKCLFSFFFLWLFNNTRHLKNSIAALVSFLN